MPTRPGASRGLSNELIDILNIWARFIYGPLLDDRVRTIAEARSPGDTAGAKPSRCIRRLRTRARSGCRANSCSWTARRSGSAACFCTCNAELNFYRLFNDTIIDADLGEVARRQKEAFTAAGVPLPDAGS